MPAKQNIIFYSLVFALSLGFSYFIVTNYFLSQKASQNQVLSEYKPSFNYESGKELLMIYIGSPHCGFSNSDEMLGLVEDAKLQALKVAQKHNINFAVNGVAISWSPKEGFNHLSKFGYFDEIFLGRSWFNTGAIKYIHTELPSGTKGSVPQIVLVMRDVIYKKHASKNEYDVKNQLQVVRYEGLNELKNFAKSDDLSLINKTIFNNQ